jgi:hypothetical protein
VASEFKDRAATPRLYMKAMGGDARQAGCWQDGELLRYQASSWRAFARVQCVCLQLDGTRLGKPGEETYVGYAWSADTKVGVWLPPQVFSRELLRPRKETRFCQAP